MSNILVFIEHKSCVLNKTSLEAITAAQAIAKNLNLTVSAVLPCDKDLRARRGDFGIRSRKDICREE